MEHVNPVEQLQKSIQMFETLAVGRECREKLWQYDDAFRQSLISILEDTECSTEKKQQYMNISLEQYTVALKALFPQLLKTNLSKTSQGEAVACVGKFDPNHYDIIQEVQKYNSYHGKDGRFAASF